MVSHNLVALRLGNSLTPG